MGKTVLFNQAPRWQNNRQGTRHKLPAAVQSWVYEPGSLTRRLRAHYGSAVTVTVLMQVWGRPFLSEQQALKLNGQSYCLVREVLLHADGKPLLLARTIIPASTIKVARSNLSQLGTRPLGEVLFSYPKLERRVEAVSLIKPKRWTQSVAAKAAINQNVWGRRTVYGIAHKDMLVSEFFLAGALIIPCKP